MAGEVIVDALPYIDQGYEEPGVREAALAMVDEETRRYRPTKNYLEHLPQLNLCAFETDIMKVEFERMQQRQPMDLLSMKRYELPPPPAGKMTDIAAWTECVENSMAQLEHQATRICNLELMLEYGCEAWKSYLEILIQLVLQAQKQLQNVRKQIQETNWQRKNEQLHAGERLRQLESTWVGLVSKNYEIEQACAILEKDIMRSRYMQSRGYSPEPEVITLDLDDEESQEQPMEVDEVQYVATTPRATVQPTVQAVQAHVHAVPVRAPVQVSPVQVIPVQARPQPTPVQSPTKANVQVQPQAPVQQRVHVQAAPVHIQTPVQVQAPIHHPVQVQAPIHTPVQVQAPIHTPIQVQVPIHTPVQVPVPSHTPVQLPVPSHTPVQQRQPTPVQTPVQVQVPVQAPVQQRQQTTAVQTRSVQPSAAPATKYVRPESPIEDKDDSTTDDDDDTDDVVDEDSEEEPPLGMLRASSPF